MVEHQSNMPDLGILASKHTILYEVPEEDIKDEIFMNEDPLVVGEGASPKGKANVKKKRPQYVPVLWKY